MLRHPVYRTLFRPPKETNTDLGTRNCGVAVTKVWKEFWTLVMGIGWKNVCSKRNPDCLGEIVGRNMDIKGDSGLGSEGREGSCRKTSYGHREYVYV